MPTWVFFMGITVLTMVLCVVITILWLGKNSDKEDDLDRRLKELAAQNAQNRAARDGEK